MNNDLRQMFNLDNVNQPNTVPETTSASATTVTLNGWYNDNTFARSGFTLMDAA